jgi:hypothetical protein
MPKNGQFFQEKCMFRLERDEWRGSKEMWIEGKGCIGKGEKGCRSTSLLKWLSMGWKKQENV